MRHEREQSIKSICLLGARLGTGNMGVGALAMGSITVAKNAFPDAQLFILDYDDERGTDRCFISGKTVGIPLVNMRFSKNPFLKNHVLRLILLAALLRTLPSKTIRSFVLNRNGWLADIAKADLCLSIAGGDSFADIYGLERFFYIALPQVLCLLLKIPLVHLPQTYGPFKSRVARLTTALILSRSRAIFSRDREGVALVRALQGRARSPMEAVFSYDVGFVLEPRRPVSLPGTFESLLGKNAGNLVGVNISGLLWMGGYTRNNMFGLTISYPDFTRKVLRYFLDVRGAAVVLVPHVAAVGRSREADDAVCKEVYEALRGEYGERILFDAGPYDQNETKYIIGKTSFFIGARMHACIAALSQGVPAIGVAYSKKFKGVLSSIGQPELVVDPSKQTQEELLATIAALYERRDAIAAALRDTMPSVKTKTLAMLKGLSP